MFIFCLIDKLGRILTSAPKAMVKHLKQHLKSCVIIILSKTTSYIS